MIARTPAPPYYAVIFSSVRTEGDAAYSEMAERMLRLAAEQDGFLGVESARSEYGITVSFWRDKGAILKWRFHAEHILAQKMGRSDWYKTFKVRISLVEREYGFPAAY